MVDILQKLFK